MTLRCPANRTPGAAPEIVAWRADANVARCATCGRRVQPDRGCAEHLARAAPPAEIARRIALPQVLGHRVIEVLGQGGFGTVVAAEQIVDGQRVALKIAHAHRADASERLLREIGVLSAVGPPHVPALYGFGSASDGSLFASMELIASPTLADHLARGVSPDAVGPIASAMIRAVAGVHAKGCVHRDLKPENILIGNDGRAVVIDFGAAVLRGKSATRQETEEQAIVGTVEYMAPEQCEGRPDIDARADVYGLGVILYELIEGHPPFWGPPTLVRENHMSVRPPRIDARVSPALVEIVFRCLAKAPEHRFPTVDELGQAWERALSQSAGAAAIAGAGECAAPESQAGLTFGAPGRLSAPSASIPMPAVEPAPQSSVGESAPQERRTVSIVFFESTAGPAAVRRWVQMLGGHVAHASSDRYVALFDHEAFEHPVRAAYRAACSLVREGRCAGVLVDVASVAVQTRGDGSKRFLTRLFSRTDRAPPAGGRRGVTLTDAAAALLPRTPDELEEAQDAAGAQPSERASPPSVGARRDASAARIFGRDALLDELVASARDAAEARAPTLEAVIGEAGHGKTHLASALAARLRAAWPDAALIALQAGEPSVVGAAPAARQLIRRIFDLPATPAEGRHAAPPIVAMALGWIEPNATELSPLQAAPGALRSALIAQAGEALRRRATEKPVFVIVDDAHLADDVMLAALEYAALANAKLNPGARLWVCAIGRPAFEQASPSWGERAARRGVRRLGPLDPASAAALCRALLYPAENVPDTAVQHLVARADAIPLHLVELIHGLKRDGLVREDPNGRAFYVATDEIDRLPDLPVIEWLAQREIAALGPSLQAHARLCALLGDEVTIPEIDGALRHLDRLGAGADFRLDARVGTERLLSAKVLAQNDRGELSFRKSLIRDAFVKTTSEAQRRALHRAILEMYRVDDDIADERWLPKIAFHAERAGEGAIAEAALVALAEQARERHAYVEAELLYSRALEQREGKLLRGGIYRGRGQMRYRVGRYHDAIEDFARARAIAAAEGDPELTAEILLEEAIALDWMRELQRSQERAEQARELLEGVRSPRLEAALSLALGRSLYRHDRCAEATPLLQRAVEVAERLEDEGYETLVISLLVQSHMFQVMNRLDDAERALTRAIALSEAHGDALHLMVSVLHRAMLRSLCGDKAGMLTDFARVLEMARQLGNGTMEWVTEINCGELLYLMDDVDAAEPHIRRAVVMNEQQRADGDRQLSALLEARMRFYRGDEEAARRLVARIRADQARARAEGQVNDVLAPSEDVLCAALELALEGAGDDAWADVDARSSMTSVGQEPIEVLELRAISAYRRGRLDEAERRFEAALTLARQIPNVMTARIERQLATVRAPHAAPSRER